MENIEIINPDDKDYYDGKLYKVGIWPGAGYQLVEFYVYASDESTALDLVVVDAEINAPNLLYSIDEVMNQITDDFQDEYVEFKNEYEDADDFTFAQEYLNYIYVDATMEGASQPYFVNGENLVIEEVQDIKEENKKEEKVKDYVFVIYRPRLTKSPIYVSGPSTETENIDEAITFDTEYDAQEYRDNLELSYKEQYKIGVKNLEENKEVKNENEEVPYDNTTEKECPKCHKKYTQFPAISRRDNKTYICPQCGVDEAIEDMLKNKKDENKEVKKENKVRFDGGYLNVVMENITEQEFWDYIQDIESTLEGETYVGEPTSVAWYDGVYQREIYTLDDTENESKFVYYSSEYNEDTNETLYTIYEFPNEPDDGKTLKKEDYDTSDIVWEDFEKYSQDEIDEIRNILEDLEVEAINNDGHSVAVKIKSNDMIFWLDFYNDGSDIVGEWNQYIFDNTNSEDRTRQAIQTSYYKSTGDVLAFDIMESEAISYLLEKGIIKDSEDGYVFTQLEENKEIKKEQIITENTNVIWSNDINDISQEDFDSVWEDFETNILPMIDNQLVDDVLVMSGQYNSNYPEFKKSGIGGELFIGIDKFKDYISEFDTINILNMNNNIGISLADHDGIISGGLYTIPQGDKKIELLKAMGYDERIQNDYDEAYLDKYNHNDLIEIEFSDDLYYGGVDAQDFTTHLNLLVPIKNEFSVTPDDDKSKKENKEIKKENKQYNLKNIFDNISKTVDYALAESFYKVFENDLDDNGNIKLSEKEIQSKLSDFIKQHKEDYQINELKQSINSNFDLENIKTEAIEDDTRLYELIYIIKGSLDETVAIDLGQEIVDVIRENAKSVNISGDPNGFVKKSALTYPIQNEEEGYYFDEHFMTSRENGQKILSDVKNVEGVIKALLFDLTNSDDTELESKQIKESKFDKISKKILDKGKQDGMTKDDADAIAASIGRKKYGKEKFQKMAQKGKKAEAKLHYQESIIPKSLIKETNYTFLSPQTIGDYSNGTIEAQSVVNCKDADDCKNKAKKFKVDVETVEPGESGYIATMKGNLQDICNFIAGKKVNMYDFMQDENTSVMLFKENKIQEDNDVKSEFKLKHLCAGCDKDMGFSDKTFCDDCEKNLSDEEKKAAIRKVMGDFTITENKTITEEMTSDEAKQKFIDFCEGKVKDLGTIDAKDGNTYKILLTSDSYKQAQPEAYLTQDDDYLIVIDKSGEVVINSDMDTIMTDVGELDFTAIDTELYNEILDNWEDYDLADDFTYRADADSQYIKIKEMAKQLPAEIKYNTNERVGGVDVEMYVDNMPNIKASTTTMKGTEYIQDSFDIDGLWEVSTLDDNGEFNNYEYVTGWQEAVKLMQEQMPKVKKENKELKHPELNNNIKDFYTSTYKDDVLANQITNTVTFQQLYRALKDKVDIYEVIGTNDSTVRERLFKELARILNTDYDYVYNMWQNGAVDGQPNVIKEDVNEEITLANIKQKAQEILPAEDIDTHYGDLYIKVSDKSTELVNKMKDKDSGLVEIFTSEIDGQQWYDIPFANWNDDYNKLNEAQEGTLSVELNTGVLPIVNVDMYSMGELINDYDVTQEELDEIVMELAPEYIEDTLKDILADVSIVVESVYHPSQYNFSGDELEFTLNVSRSSYESLKETTLQDDKFKSFLKQNYSSYDGFVSYMADSIDDFETQDEWKQVVQVIMFNIPENVIEYNNESYINTFIDKLSSNYPMIEDEDLLDESKKVEKKQSMSPNIEKMVSRVEALEKEYDKSNRDMTEKELCADVKKIIEDIYGIKIPDIKLTTLLQNGLGYRFKISQNINKYLKEPLDTAITLDVYFSEKTKVDSFTLDPETDLETWGLKDDDRVSFKSNNEDTKVDDSKIYVLVMNNFIYWEGTEEEFDRDDDAAYELAIQNAIADGVEDAYDIDRSDFELMTKEELKKELKRINAIKDESKKAEDEELSDTLVKLNDEMHTYLFKIYHKEIIPSEDEAIEKIKSIIKNIYNIDIPLTFTVWPNANGKPNYDGSIDKMSENLNQYLKELVDSIYLTLNIKDEKVTHIGLWIDELEFDENGK